MSRSATQHAMLIVVALTICATILTGLIFRISIILCQRLIWRHHWRRWQRQWLELESNPLGPCESISGQIEALESPTSLAR